MLLLLPHAGEAVNLSHPVSVDLLEDEEGGEIFLGEQLHDELLPHGVTRSHLDGPIPVQPATAGRTRPDCTGDEGPGGKKAKITSHNGPLQFLLFLCFSCLNSWLRLHCVRD